ncbi:PAS domain S-box protein, partial [Roseisolibacter sp. H3M3-2]|uniref:PAS domain S-box protein n=1 Tax=Roseisolibacter sp. H3M3-2 TaxID=3031323 RepID=UPI0023D9BFFC
PWAAEDRALAAAFARLAGDADAASDGALRTRLAELERHVDEMQAVTSLGSFEWSVPDDRVAWSAEQLRIHGLDPASHPRDLAGFLACVHPDDRAGVAEQTARMLRDGGMECTYRVVRPDGTERTVHSRGRASYDAAGNVARVVGTSMDVTAVRDIERELRAANERLEQRVAERTAELRRSEEHFRRLIEHAHDLIVIVDDDGRPRYGSPSVRRILGWDPREIDGTEAPPPYHPDDLPRIAGWVRGLAERPGETHQLEYRLRHKAGHWLTLEAVCAVPADYRRGAGHVLNIRDATERTRAEAALRESEGRLRALIEQLPAIIYTASVEEGYPTLFVSPQAERLLGYREDEWRANGRLWLDAVHPGDRERVERDWNAAHAEGRRFAAEYRMVTRDGRVLWFRDEAAVLRGADGRPRHIQGVMLDVTDRRRAEEALSAREEYFRRLIENSSDLLMISGTDMRLTYVSPSAERMFGYAPSEMLARQPADLLHPDDVPLVLDVMRDIIEHPGAQRRVTWRIRHRDGGWRTIDAIGRTIDPHSAADGVVCNGRDVTEQREAELALQRSEEHFRALIERSYDLVQVLDARGHVVYTGPSVQRLLGYTPEEIAGMTIPDFMHPDDLPAAAELVGRVLAAPGTSGSLEYRVRHKDGSWRWFEAWARTLSPTSADDGLVANARDVTSRREALEALRRATADAEQAREEAERANRAKSEFLSRMSHELRTPMNSILGFAQVLEDVELPPAYRGGVRHILNAGRHLLRLIDEVLDIARIEADAQPLAIEPVRVDAAVREAIDMVSPLAAKRGVRVVELPPAGERRFVRADRQRLVQVLLNLLSNAVKYNREQGAVRIGVSAAAGPDGAERVRVLVEDEGRGIAPAARDQLFVPFARLGAEQTDIEGTGLGLALSQRLARAMGAELTLERTGPGGSAFAVDLLPAEGVAAALPVVPAPGAAAGAGGAATLLYVEDNLANLTLVETILSSRRPGWRLVPALQGRLGLELAAEHGPDVVLLDLHLPDMHGREVLRRLRGAPRTAATPVVVISADATPKTVDALAAEGADAYLTKPLDVRAFVATVDRLLARARRG